MTTLKTLGSVAALVSLCGCQSLTVMALKTFDPKPYSLPVAAAELEAIPATGEGDAAVEASPGAAPAQAAADVVATAELTVLAEPAAAAPEPTPEPVRTDVRGLGDGSMTDERVVVVARKEISHRVPNYSREQVAAMVCARLNTDNAGRLKNARRAYEATLAAYDARIAFEAGRITAKEADAAERKRQDAVGAISGNNFFFNMFGGSSKKSDLPKPELDGLVLENVDLFTFSENGRPVMAVSGVVRNTTQKRVEPPPLTLAAIDQWQFILAGQTSLLPFEALEPGESKAFEVRFHNPPDTTFEVYAHFAPPFEYRMRRECDLADVTTETPIAMAPRSASQAAAMTSPVHTSAELNVLTRIYRTEAASAWNLRACGLSKEEAAARETERQKGTRTGPGGLRFSADGAGERRGLSISMSMANRDASLMCAAWSRRLPWSETFALAEATDEAWGAQLALGEMQRRLAAGTATQADVDAADAAWRGAYATFRALGEKTLARAGGSTPGVNVEIASSNFGYEQMTKVFDGADISQVGFYVDVSGVLRNTVAEPRKVGALMLAVVDRLEHPMLTFRLDEEVELGANETREFKQRVYFSDPMRRWDSKEAPAWQVRIGAVSR